MSVVDRLPGGVTAAAGFAADGVACGIKRAAGVRDLGLLVSEVECTAAAVFTTNRIQAAPVRLSRRHVACGRAQALFVNSGNANACAGAGGEADALAMAELAAQRLGLATERILVASTGMIGQRLPMEKIRRGLAELQPSRAGGGAFAEAIVTTDSMPKEFAVRVALGRHEAGIGGAAKGSGMIHPNMATMLAFLTTDAAVPAPLLQDMLRTAVDRSFHAITVDGDTSTNDSVFLLANGRSGAPPLVAGSPEALAFQEGLDEVCKHLAKAIARDGEGSTKLIEVQVRGALDDMQARLVARTVAGSSLVKAAVYGSDPNWGRIACAAGYSGAEVDFERMDVAVGAMALVRGGEILAFDRHAAAEALRGPDVLITLDLHLGAGTGMAWGCDLTERYVEINAEYTT
ncbi:MAG: bifunctional glutamate N-acetyltransferase/amino-acid acetyltransferase ArgJ [Chloroflexi bacterium]|nr:bifunctional glutamate N-acetyltransferase/amino-acid acetyltransferase ArgJ [Chloroflexota bacterium]